MESRIIETKAQPKKESWEKSLSILEWSALVLFILFLLLYFSKSILAYFGVELNHPIFSHDTWGVFGDFIGGVLGTFIAYISVRLLVKTLYHQISANRETARINKETAIVYKLQQFNEQFKILFALYQDALHAYKTSDMNSRTDFSSIVDQFKKHGDTTVKNDDYAQRQLVALDIFKDFYVTYHNVASVHFRLLYRIFQLIDDADIPERNKTDIAKIMRCQLSADEILLLRYNAIASYGEKMRLYINRYNLLKHLPFFSLLELSHLSIKLSEVQRHSINTEVIKWRKQTKGLLLKNKIGNDSFGEDYSEKYSIKITVSANNSFFKIELTKNACKKYEASETNISKAFDAFNNDELKCLLLDFVSELFLYSNFSIYNSTNDLNVTPEITEKKEGKKTIISVEVTKHNDLPLICSQMQMENPVIKKALDSGKD